MFRPQSGATLWLYILGALLVSAVLFFALQAMPGRARKPLVALITFVAGLYYAAEFFWPTGPSGENWLSPAKQPISDISQVLQAFALGLSVPQVAAELFLGVSTVKTHTQRLYEKLGVSDRAAAVAEGMRRGLVE